MSSRESLSNHGSTFERDVVLRCLPPDEGLGLSEKKKNSHGA